ncbi:MAG TPA: acyl-CoA dehydrogenase family protein [Bryobacteraceae bacterium]|nr:acyl-CoA dehydrogenase family protein [Bryobacteraceae bacterium]
MNFGLTETQTTLKNSVREFLNAECPIALVRKLAETETAFDEGLWKKIAAQGWTGLLFPEEYGGFGMGMVDLGVVLEEMGRALLPGPFLSTVLAGAILDLGGSDEHKEKYLSAICRSEAKSTLALLEAGASWEIDGVNLAAARNSGGYSLTGRKLFVPDAAVADFLICAARVDGDLALFIVPSAAQGLNVRHTPAIDLTRKLYEVTFENVAAGEAEIIAQGEAAWSVLESALDIATAGLTAEMTGGMGRLVELAVGYAKTRKQFGKPIGQFQAVQHMCADMLLFTESSRSAAYYACWVVGEGLPEAAEAVSIAKSYASEAYRETGNRAIQVHGGMGFLWENDAHLYYRRAKGSEIAFGDAVFHRERLAKLVVDTTRHTVAAC